MDRLVLEPPEIDRSCGQSTGRPATRSTGVDAVRGSGSARADLIGRPVPATFAGDRDRPREMPMLRFAALITLSLLVFAAPATAQTPPPGPSATPSDYMLLTIIMRHDQTKNLD